MSAVDGVSGLYGGMDMAKVMFGQSAITVPAWFWVQGGGPGVASFIGVSRIPGFAGHHPLHFGSPRTHQLVIGEIIIRPRSIIGTDGRRGSGLGHLVMDVPTVPELLGHDCDLGEVIMHDGVTVRSAAVSPDPGTVFSGHDDG